MKNLKLSAERARELLSYDPETGDLTWKKRVGGRTSAGKKAGSIQVDGYVQLCVEYNIYRAHRLAILIQTGEWPGLVDHINGVRSDNRLSNLRVVPKRVNQENRKGAQANSKTGLLGASPKRGKFVASIGTLGKRRYLGTYDTPEEAHAAYLTAKRNLHVGCTI